MASLMKALANFFRDQRDQTAEALGDPVRDGRFAIEDSKKAVDSFETKIARHIALNKSLVKKRDEQREEITKWTRIAGEAAKAKNREDVAAAVANKQNAEGQVNTFDQEIARNDTIISRLRDDLSKARAKIGRAESNQAQLAARLEGAKVRKELNSGFKLDGGPLASLDRLQQAVDSAESEAEAYEELNEDAGGDLETKYSGTGAASVDAEVERLMAGAA